MLATEVWKLRKQLSEFPGTSSEKENHQDSQNGLDNYDPNNQHALRRKISKYTPSSARIVIRTVSLKQNFVLRPELDVLLSPI